MLMPCLAPTRTVLRTMAEMHAFQASGSNPICCSMDQEKSCCFDECKIAARIPGYHTQAQCRPCVRTSYLMRKVYIAELGTFSCKTCFLLTVSFTAQSNSCCSWHVLRQEAQPGTGAWNRQLSLITMYLGDLHLLLQDR
jgi:hypothetical protein